MRNLSPLALYGVLAVLVAFALMGVLLVAPGNESMYRLGLLFGVIGTAIAAVVGMIKADQSATQTNGQMDARIQYAVHTALDARRRGDAPTPPTDPAPPTDAS